jgi:hypothetical protein
VEAGRAASLLGDVLAGGVINHPGLRGDRSDGPVADTGEQVGVAQGPDDFRIC